MKKLIIISLSVLCSINALSWGQKGHDIVAYIAEQHLSAKAKKEVTKVLDGHSLVYYSNWCDNVKYTDEFRYTSTWHYLNINEDEDINTFKRNPKGDAESAITSIVNQLKADTLDAKAEGDAVRMLVHFVGDLHCPMHLGRETDRGGNNVKIKYFGQKTNLHSIWDSKLVESAHKWSYTEWQKQIDLKSKKEIKQIQSSLPIDWAKESHQIAKEVYDFIPEGTNVRYDHISKYAPVIENQLLKGGYRLAALLNEIYK